jgi:hypothetical protein
MGARWWSDEANAERSTPTAAVPPLLWPKGRRTSWGILPDELRSSSRIERLRPRVFCTEVEVVEEEFIFWLEAAKN